MGNMHLITGHEAANGRQADQGTDEQLVQARYIELNLRRAYQATLSEQLPPRFHALIAALREKEARK